MDGLKIRSIEYAKKGQVENTQSIPLAVRLMVNDLPFADALDLHEFLRTLTHPGLSPLFTCPICGIFCCEGYYVNILHTETAYVFENTYDCFDSSKIINGFRDEIPWWQVQKVVKELSNAVAKIPKDYPHLKRYMNNWIPSLEQFAEASQIIQRRLPKN